MDRHLDKTMHAGPCPKLLMCWRMLKASDLTAPDFNPGKPNRENRWRPERPLEPMRGTDRSLSASFQDAFQSIAGNPGLKSGAVMLDAFSIPFVAIFSALPLRRKASLISAASPRMNNWEPVLAMKANVDLNPFATKLSVIPD